MCRRLHSFRRQTDDSSLGVSLLLNINTIRFSNPYFSSTLPNSTVRKVDCWTSFLNGSERGISFVFKLAIAMSDSTKRQHEDSDDEFVGPMPVAPTETSTKKRKGKPYHKATYYSVTSHFDVFFTIFKLQFWNLKVSI